MVEWNYLNGLHVCVNAVMVGWNYLNGLHVCVNAVMIDVELFEWFTCMCEYCNGKWVNDKHGMIGMYGA